MFRMNSNAIRGHRQIGMACKAQAAPSQLAQGLLAYWPMNENAGSARVNVIKTGVGDLVETGGTVARVTGLVYDYAADWPADQSEAHYLALAHAAKGPLAVTGAAISRTVAFWLYLYDGSDSALSYRNIWWNSGNSTGAPGENIRVNQEDRVWCTWTSSATIGPIVHGPVATLNAWELWFAVQDAASDSYTLYKWPSTGIEEQNESGEWTYGQEGNSNAIEVCSPGTNGNATHRLGPLMVWNRVLSDAERALVWRSGSGWAFR